MTSQGWQNALQKSRPVKNGQWMDRSCYIILLVLILLCRGYTTHHARFGIEGYHAIIKIARDHLLPYIYILHYLWTQDVCVIIT